MDSKPMMRVLTLCLSFAASAVAAHAGDLVGTVHHAIDGDDLLICGADGQCHDIRLCGIDAPDRGTRRATAKVALDAWTRSREVRCIPVGEGTVCDGRSRPTNRGRMVAQCFVAGIDVAGEQVRLGHACDWVKYSGGAYGGKPC